MSAAVSCAGNVPVRGPKPIPLLGGRGNLLRFFHDPVGAMLRLHREYGSVAALTDGDASIVCAFGAEHNRRVLSNPDAFVNNEQFLFRLPEKGSVRRLEAGLPLMNGEAHRRLRRLMAPFFQKAAIERHGGAMVRITDQALHRFAASRRVDMSREMLELSLRVALECLFGVRADDEVARLGELGTRHLEGLTSAGAMLLPFDVPGSPYWKLTRASDELERRLRDIIRKKRAQADPAEDVFAAVLAARSERDEALTDEELVGQANTLFLAGHETTAYTLAWTLLLVAQHPRVAADLRDEIHGELRGSAPTIENIGRLALLDRVVKESMRLLPPAPMTFLRYAVDDGALGPVALRRGAAVILSPIVTHRAPDVFSDAMRFRPERWEGLRPTIYEYLPFGAGPRMCIGAAFAAVEVRIVLAMLLQRFFVAMVPRARVSRVVRGVTMGPRHGLPMHVGLQPARPASLRGDIGDLVRFQA